jgi:DNA-binding CsgD family transcriptional regulator
MGKQSDMEYIKESLNAIIGLLALSNTQHMRQSDRIVLMGQVGMKPRDIARLLKTTQNTVSVTLSKSKNKK